MIWSAPTYISDSNVPNNILDPLSLSMHCLHLRTSVVLNKAERDGKVHAMNNTLWHCLLTLM